MVMSVCNFVNPILAALSTILHQRAHLRLSLLTLNSNFQTYKLLQKSPTKLEKMGLTLGICHQKIDRMANSADPDHTANRVAVWSRSALFA